MRCGLRETIVGLVIAGSMAGCSCESAPSADTGVPQDTSSLVDAASPVDALALDDAFTLDDALTLDDAFLADAPWPFDANGCVLHDEGCNGLDDDCDGTVDDGDLCASGLRCLGGSCRRGGGASWISVLPNTDARAVAVDSTGRIAVVGCLHGTVTLAGEAFSSYGASDSFALQLAADGSHLWAQRYGGDTGSLAECAHGVAVWRDDDRLAITGDFGGDVLFGGLGSGVVASSTGALDGYAIALGYNGVLIWQRLFSNGPTGEVTMSAVTFDAMGNAYVGGRASQRIQPNGDVQSAMDAAGDGFVYLLHRDDGVPDGVPTRYTSAGADGVTALAFSTSQLLTVGFAGAAMDFGAGPVAFGGGAADAFVVVSPRSDPPRGRFLGGAADDRAYAGAFAYATRLVVGGSFAEAADFGGGVRHRRGTSQETFVTAESSTDLAWSWDRETGTANDDRVRAIVADGGGGVYVGGVDTVPFVRHYDSEGLLVWERSFGESGAGVGVHGLAVAPDGTVVVVGVMNGTITEGTITAIGPGAFVAAIHD